MPISLTVDQVAILREAILRREVRIRPDSGPTAGNLRWAFEVQIGLGLRLGEVLGLRNADVDFEAGRVSVSGTLVDDEVWRVVRQSELKSRDQARIIEAPRFVLAALAEARSTRESLTDRLPIAPALQSRAGTWIAPRNLRRAFRHLRSDSELIEALRATGIEPDRLTHHVLRRTAATLLGCTAAVGPLRATRQHDHLRDRHRRNRRHRPDRREHAVAPRRLQARGIRRINARD
ncbi:tyrosine-type recombinase/integrase [Microbacterium flavum]|uniref:Tyrosine-type recombinase/integrase n=1 Tax=Microbacterium flavum TaxID=415216 RepID=A0ABS5XPR3_9MICO|nr:tyrosine-type recombinase/integrase [Microbacterium flavum]